MSNKIKNQATHFEPEKNKGVNQREAWNLRDVVTFNDAALGLLFGVASRSVAHDAYHTHPAVTSGSVVVADATTTYPSGTEVRPGAHDSLGMSHTARIAETDQLNAAFQAPASDVSPQYGQVDLDLQAIRDRIAMETQNRV